jgi:hypothetical protein
MLYLDSGIEKRNMEIMFMWWIKYIVSLGYL